MNPNRDPAAQIDPGDLSLTLNQLARGGGLAIATTATPPHHAAGDRVMPGDESVIPLYARPSSEDRREAFPGFPDDEYGHEHSLGYDVVPSAIDAPQLEVLRTGPDCE